MKETNMEHFRGEIENAEYNIAVCNGKPIRCSRIHCKECEFHDKRGCSIETIAWLMAEYKPTPVLTEREKHFVEFAETGWIARDGDGRLYWYKEKPNKYTGRHYWSRDCKHMSLGVIEVFPFITWEDEEPWSVEELRKLEVKE